MEDKKLEQEFEQLNSWSRALVNSMPGTIDLVQKILKSRKPLPKGCPSRGSLAVMQFGDITKLVEEVEGACDRIRKHLLSKYKQAE
jgi:uncharacterized protein Yka (UPF0111/DUF47 family)